MKRKAYSDAVTSYTHGISILDKDPDQHGTRVHTDGYPGVHEVVWRCKAPLEVVLRVL